MICELVDHGKKVGITAVGHKVIRKLLDEVLKAAQEPKRNQLVGMGGQQHWQVTGTYEDKFGRLHWFLLQNVPTRGLYVEAGVSRDLREKCRL
jgi:hypothetical protein